MIIAQEDPLEIKTHAVSSCHPEIVFAQTVNEENASWPCSLPGASGDDNMPKSVKPGVGRAFLRAALFEEPGDESERPTRFVQDIEDNPPTNG